MFYDLGVRYITLTHTCDNPFATSCSTVARGSPDKGLSSLGKHAVREMNRLGMSSAFRRAESRNVSRLIACVYTDYAWCTFIFPFPTNIFTLRRVRNTAPRKKRAWLRPTSITLHRRRSNGELLPKIRFWLAVLYSGYSGATCPAHSTSSRLAVLPPSQVISDEDMWGLGQILMGLMLFVRDWRIRVITRIWLLRCWDWRHGQGMRISRAFWAKIYWGYGQRPRELEISWVEKSLVRSSGMGGRGGGMVRQTLSQY